ncbi:MAG: hypothetical protein V3T43_06305 [Nitrosomonadaceae bacterium]
MEFYAIQSDFIEGLFDLTDYLIIKMKGDKFYKVTLPQPSRMGIRSIRGEFLANPSPGKYFNEIIKANCIVEKMDSSFVTVGVAQEDIRCGDRLEINIADGRVRSLRLPDLK